MQTKTWDQMNANEQHIRSVCMHKVERFDRWYRQDGHWIYPSRDAAMNQWLGKGIETMPDLCDAEREVIREWRDRPTDSN